jgi:hypothetical protein
MDAEEKDIFYYLRTEGQTFVSLSTICRHAGGKHRYRRSPEWARPALLRMEERGIVECDASGAYRLRPKPQESFNTQRWVSPKSPPFSRKVARAFKPSRTSRTTRPTTTACSRLKRHRSRVP